MSDARKAAKVLAVEIYRHKLGLLAYSEIVPKPEVDALLAHDAALRAEVKRLRALLAEQDGAGAKPEPIPAVPATLDGWTEEARKELPAVFREDADPTLLRFMARWLKALHDWSHSLANDARALEAKLALPPAGDDVAATRADMERWLTEGMLTHDEAEAIRAELHRLWSPPARDEVREAAEKLLREARNECLQRAPTGFGRARCRDWMRDRAKWCALCRGDAFLSALARPAKGDA